MIGRTIYLWHKLTDMEHIEHASQEEINAVLRELAETAMAENYPGFAIEPFQRLGDILGLKRAADLALLQGEVLDPLKAYVSLKDEEGIARVVEISSKTKDTSMLDRVLNYTGLAEKISLKGEEFVSSRGFKRSPYFCIARTFNPASILTPNYDVGVSIAHGGLWSAYAFDFFGLPIIIAEAHRKGKGATFRWHDSPERIKDSRVLVLDKDAVTGRTLRRTVREIEKYSPKSLDLFFNHDPVGSNSLYGYARLDAVPKGFGKVFYPAAFDYMNYPKIFEKLKQRFG